MEDTFGEEPVQIPNKSPRIKLSTRKTNSNFMNGENLHNKTNERLKKELAEKEAQLEKLNAQVKNFKDCCQEIRDLILELEDATGTVFLTQEQRKNIANMPHNEGILVIKKAMNHLINEYNLLPERFANEFEKKAMDLSDEIEKVESKTRAIANARKGVEKEIKMLDRTTEIQKKEKNSLQKVAESLQRSIDEQASSTQQKVTTSNQQLAKLKSEIWNTINEADQQETNNY